MGCLENKEIVGIIIQAAAHSPITTYPREDGWYRRRGTYPCPRNWRRGLGDCCTSTLELENDWHLLIPVRAGSLVREISRCLVRKMVKPGRRVRRLMTSINFRDVWQMINLRPFFWDCAWSRKMEQSFTDLEHRNAFNGCESVIQDSWFRVELHMCSWTTVTVVQLPKQLKWICRPLIILFMMKISPCHLQKGATLLPKVSGLWHMDIQ